MPAGCSIFPKDIYGHRGLRVGDAVDMGNEHAGRTQLQRPGDQLRAVGLHPHEGRDPAGIGGPDHLLGELDPVRAVLEIDRHEIKARLGGDLDARRRGQLDERPGHRAPLGPALAYRSGGDRHGHRPLSGRQSTLTWEASTTWVRVERIFPVARRRWMTWRRWSTSVARTSASTSWLPAVV